MSRSSLHSLNSMRYRPLRHKNLAYGLLCLILHLVVPVHADPRTNQDAPLLVLVNIPFNIAPAYVRFLRDLDSMVRASFPASRSPEKHCYVFAPPPKRAPASTLDEPGITPCLNDRDHPAGSDLDVILSALNSSISSLGAPTVPTDNDIVHSLELATTKIAPPGSNGNRFLRAMWVQVSHEIQSNGNEPKIRVDWLYYIPQIRSQTIKKFMVCQDTDLTAPLTTCAKQPRPLRRILSLPDGTVQRLNNSGKVFRNSSIIYKSETSGEELRTHSNDPISLPEDSYSAKWAWPLFEKEEDSFTLLYGSQHIMNLKGPHLSARAKLGLGGLLGGVAMLLTGVPLLIRSCEISPMNEPTYHCVDRSTKLDAVGGTLTSAGTLLSMVGAVLLLR